MLGWRWYHRKAMRNTLSQAVFANAMPAPHGGNAGLLVNPSQEGFATARQPTQGCFWVGEAVIR